MNIATDHVHQNRLYTSGVDQAWDLKTAVGLLVRRWRPVVASIVVCLALACLYLSHTSDRFTAKAVLVMDTKQAPPTPSQISQEPLIDPAVVDSQLEILKSDRIAAQVVDRLNLTDDPAFASPPGIFARLTGLLFGQSAHVPSDAERHLAAVSQLMQMVKINRTGHSYLADISATTTDPKLSARIANGVADGYIQDQLESSLGSSQRSVAWMQQRVAELKSQADAAGEAQSTFASAHAAELAAGDPAAAGQLKTLAAAADFARNDYQAVQNRAMRLAQFLQQQALPVTEARVLSPAEPPLSKSAPKSAVVLLLALIGGAVIGVGIASIRETLDRKLRSPYQIRAGRSLPVVGSVPSNRKAHTAGPLAMLFDAERPWCGATETLRAVKLSVDHNLRQGTQGAVIGFASPWPGEGKSTLTFNMARMLTEIGTRVLVIDADLRKPDLSRLISPGLEIGLADLVSGEVAIGSCITATSEGFDLIGQADGRVPLHPFDVLGSRRMQAAIAAARGAYDYVLIDLPSLLVSVDAQAIASFLDGFVLVTEYGRTTTDDVERALATSDAVADRVVAALLNKARGSEIGSVRRRRAIRGHRPAAVSA